MPKYFNTMKCFTQYKQIHFSSILICNNKTRWMYCVECPQYSTRLEALGYLCHCLSGSVQR